MQAGDEKACQCDDHHRSHPKISQTAVNKGAFWQRELDRAGDYGEHGKRGVDWNRLLCGYQWFEHMRMLAPSTLHGKALKPRMRHAIYGHGT